MKRAMKTALAVGALAMGALAVARAQDRPSPPPLSVTDDGTIKTPAFDLPFSSFASREAREAFVRRLKTPRSTAAPQTDMAKMRASTDNSVRPQLEFYAAQYPYTATKGKIGNVPIDTFVPKAGIAPENKNRVLISIHGGAGTHGGGGVFGALESVAIAGLARIKIVAVDYRLRPEYTTQDAIDDVLTVYRDVLKTYKPQNIGVYGCSAGGTLTASATRAMIRQNLPLPSAIGIFCASLHGFGTGDSAQLWPRLGSVLAGVPRPAPARDPNAPTDDELRKFPPTLFLTGTRAPEMSGAAQSHLDLRRLGVTSELLLFDGMDHGFFLFGASYPESQRANEFIARFFTQHLGSNRKAARSN